MVTTRSQGLPSEPEPLPVRSKSHSQLTSPSLKRAAPDSDLDSDPSAKRPRSEDVEIAVVDGDSATNDLSQVFPQLSTIASNAIFGHMDPNPESHLMSRIHVLNDDPEHPPAFQTLADSGVKADISAVTQDSEQQVNTDEQGDTSISTYEADFRTPLRTILDEDPDTGNTFVTAVSFQSNGDSPQQRNISQTTTTKHGEGAESAFESPITHTEGLIPKTTGVNIVSTNPVTAPTEHVDRLPTPLDTSSAASDINYKEGSLQQEKSIRMPLDAPTSPRVIIKDSVVSRPSPVHRRLVSRRKLEIPTAPHSLALYKRTMLERHKRTSFWGGRKVTFVDLKTR